MSSGERPIGAAKGKQSDTEALCQPPPPPDPDFAPPLCPVSALVVVENARVKLEGDDYRRFIASKRPCLVSGLAGEPSLSIFQIFLEGWILACSQTCCPGGSQACSQTCSWRAHSCGPC